MKLVEKNISLEDLKVMAENSFGNLVKAVVDVDKKLMVVDGELHSDQETELLSMGSNQKNLWGINLYPKFYKTSKFVEFDSMINLRPSFGNKTRGVENENTRKTILDIVYTLVSDK